MVTEAKLLKQYHKLCPSFNNILFKFKSHFIDYDHIAVRTFNMTQMHNLFVKNYTLEKQKFHYPDFNISATWYSNKQKVIPRVILSTYLHPIFDKNLEPELNALITYHINHPNDRISYDIYNHIYKKNQYLAWSLLFRENVSNVAIRVNSCEKIFEQIQKKYNTTPITFSKDKRLLQFTISPDKVYYQFDEGTYEVPASFVKFVERKVNPVTKETREGF